MSHETEMNRQWATLPRVQYYAQPITLGLLLAIPGGFMALMMLLAFKPEEHWVLSLCTIAMGIGFFLMFLAGMGKLLSPFHRVWVSGEEIQLRLGSLVLRRITIANVRSVTAKPREIIVRNRDFILHRLTIHCNGAWPHNRGLWMDWNPETERVLKANLPDVNFLF